MLGEAEAALPNLPRIEHVVRRRKAVSRFFGRPKHKQRAKLVYEGRHAEAVAFYDRFRHLVTRAKEVAAELSDVLPTWEIEKLQDALRPTQVAGTTEALRQALVRLDECWEACDTKPVSADEPRKRRHGPKPNFSKHEKIAEAVDAIGSNWREDDQLARLVRMLDEARVPGSRGWADWKTVPRSWQRAAQYAPDLVIKTIEYSLSVIERSRGE